MNSNKKKILLVEDEPHLAFNIEYNLQLEGFNVTPAANGLIALEKWQQEGPYDLIILDVMIPEMNGFEVARKIRHEDIETGILLLTARAAEKDIIEGLETGADDYMTKPFHLKEFILRVKRMAARSEILKHSNMQNKRSHYNEGEFSLNIDSLELRCPKGRVHLTALEADVMKEFLTNPHKVLSRKHLLEAVWGLKGRVETRTVDNFVMRLRKHIERDPSTPNFLESVRGRGYRFNPKKKEGDSIED